MWLLHDALPSLLLHMWRDAGDSAPPFLALMHTVLVLDQLGASRHVCDQSERGRHVCDQSALCASRMTITQHCQLPQCIAHVAITRSLSGSAHYADPCGSTQSLVSRLSRQSTSRAYIPTPCSLVQ